MSWALNNWRHRLKSRVFPSCLQIYLSYMGLFEFSFLIFKRDLYPQIKFFLKIFSVIFLIFWLKKILQILFLQNYFSNVYQNSSFEIFYCHKISKKKTFFSKFFQKNLLFFNQFFVKKFGLRVTSRKQIIIILIHKQSKFQISKMEAIDFQGLKFFLGGGLFFYFPNFEKKFSYAP